MRRTTFAQAVAVGFAHIALERWSLRPADVPHTMVAVDALLRLADQVQGKR